jgi:hygromycin-B 7''-O-kinase
VEGRLGEVEARLGLGPQAWVRPRAGMSTVFMSDALVVKLYPARDRLWWEAERLLLARAHGRLGVPTPALVGAEALEDGVLWLVMERLEGQIAREVWPEVDRASRAQIALRAGAAMAALHGLSGEGLERVWEPAHETRQVAVDAAIGRQVRAGLDAAPARAIDALARQWGKELGTEQVPLHADLHWEQALLVRDGAGWRLGAIIDLADGMRGPRAFELVSPFFEWLGTDPFVRAAFLDGYGWPADERGEAFEQTVLLLGLLHPWNMVARRSPADVTLAELVERFVRVR